MHSALRFSHWMIRKYAHQPVVTVIIPRNKKIIDFFESRGSTNYSEQKLNPTTTKKKCGKRAQQELEPQARKETYLQQRTRPTFQTRKSRNTAEFTIILLKQIVYSGRWLLSKKRINLLLIAFWLCTCLLLRLSPKTVWRTFKLSWKWPVESIEPGALYCWQRKESTVPFGKQWNHYDNGLFLTISNNAIIMYVQLPLFAQTCKG